MAKPSNEELLAERREIARLLDAADGESNLDALNRIFEEHRANVLAAEKKGEDDLAKAGGEIQRLLRELAAARAVQPIPDSAPVVETPAPCDPSGVVPAMDPALGDLTPDYARFRLATASLAECREQYAHREQYLPADVRETMKGDQ
jgi:hypothetical protein